MAYKPTILTSAEGGTGSNNTATSGKILIGDGTNFVSSTPTYPTTAGSNGNVLTSDGTNWTSAAPASGAVSVVTGRLTSAQVKSLNGTPIQVVAAPGAGKVIRVVSVTGGLNYGGTNVFVAAASQVIVPYYGTTSTTGTNVLGNANITASTNQRCMFAPVSQNGQATLYDNLALNLWNPIATEISGNAANDNTVDYSIIYYISE